VTRRNAVEAENVTRPDMVMCWSGEQVWFDQPHRTRIDWVDLDRYLVNLNRYNGGIPWNLARHHLLVAEMAVLYFPDCPPTAKSKLLAKLLVHDIHEVYVGDMVNGLKRFCPDYQRIELLWEHYLWDSIYPGRAGEFDTPWNEVAKLIDRRAVLIETWLLAPKIYQYLIDNGTDPITLAEQELVRNISNTPDAEVLKTMKHYIVLQGGNIGSS
jgi:hypothetical protein